MTPRLRKFALTAHVTFSVGWLGAVACFLALAVAGLTSRDAQMVRAGYLAMELISWFVIVPCSFAALLSGLVQSLGTQWGLFRHYWILVKFVLTIVATIILLVHMQPIVRMSDVAAETTLSSADFGRLRIQLVADAGLALLVLLAVSTLAVYKPWGRTGYGVRKQHEGHKVSQSIPTHPTTSNRADAHMADLPSHPDSNGDTGVGTDRGSTTTSCGLYVLFGIIGLVLLFVVLHLSGGGLGGN